MANTTNYNWETPDDTDLVKDGAAAIRTLGSSIDTTTKALNPSTTLGDIEYRSATANTNTRLGIGSTGQVLTVAGGVPTWATSDDANAIQNAIVDAKGDIVAASAADTPARLAVGTDNQRLVAASGEATGLKYVSDTQNTVIDAEGDLLVGDAADALQRLAIGSNAQVLTVDTTVDGKIKWATPAGGGGGALELVKARTTFSNVADTSSTFDGVFTSTYRNYLIILDNVYGATTDADLQMIMKYGTNTEQTVTYYWSDVKARFNVSVGTSQGNDAGSYTISDAIGGSAYPGGGTINLNAGVASESCTIQSQYSTTFYGSVDSAGGGSTVARTYTGFKLLASAGNITGAVTIYGLKVS